MSNERDSWHQSNVGFSSYFGWCWYQRQCSCLIETVALGSSSIQLNVDASTVMRRRRSSIEFIKLCCWNSIRNEDMKTFGRFLWEQWLGQRQSSSFICFNKTHFNLWATQFSFDKQKHFKCTIRFVICRLRVLLFLVFVGNRDEWNFNDKQKRTLSPFTVSFDYSNTNSFLFRWHLDNIRSFIFFCSTFVFSMKVFIGKWRTGSHRTAISCSEYKKRDFFPSSIEWKSQRSKLLEWKFVDLIKRWAL